MGRILKKKSDVCNPVIQKAITEMTEGHAASYSSRVLLLMTRYTSNAALAYSSSNIKMASHHSSNMNLDAVHIFQISILDLLASLKLISVKHERNLRVSSNLVLTPKRILYLLARRSLLLISNDTYRPNMSRQNNIPA